MRGPRRGSECSLAWVRYPRQEKADGEASCWLGLRRRLPGQGDGYVRVRQGALTSFAALKYVGVPHIKGNSR